MSDAKESLRRYFVMTDQGISTSLDRIEAMIETLRIVLPGFKEEYSRQTELQAERRAEQASRIGETSPHQADRLVQTLESLFGR